MARHALFLQDGDLIVIKHNFHARKSAARRLRPHAAEICRVTCEAIQEWATMRRVPVGGPLYDEKYYMALFAETRVRRL